MKRMEWMDSERLDNDDDGSWRVLRVLLFWN